MRKIELLAPAGDREKLETALHFGADAVYLAGKNFGLRAYAGNFDEQELANAIQYAHANGAKVYVTVNILAKQADFATLPNYFSFLQSVGADGAIISDLGVLAVANKAAPKLAKHISTQASVTNLESVKQYVKLGASRIVLARECTLNEVGEIAEKAPCEIEVFVHGAMCISYSGRCLLSNYYTSRQGNRGECVQACRWKYDAQPLSILPEGEKAALHLYEDDRGSYLLNSKDLNMLPRLGHLLQTKVASYKIEGRMKSPYYVATVVNAYARAIDSYYKCGEYLPDQTLIDDVNKASHRDYTFGFYYGEENSVNLASSRAVGEATFVATVLDYADGFITVQMRNRFRLGDELEILSNNQSFNQRFTVEQLAYDGLNTDDAKLVMGIYRLSCPYTLSRGDILRKPINQNILND